MPDFLPHALDRAACRAQVQELKALLDGSPDIGEAAFHDFFEPKLRLRALVGTYNPALAFPDRLAWQYPIFGDFRCDFAIGDWDRKAYTFVEYEDARPNSLFARQGERAARAWSSRFASGFSQIIDWFYKLHVMMGVLIAGRDQHLQTGERLRLDWWQDHVVVNSKHILCVTYDQLVQDLLVRLDQYTGASVAIP